VQRRQLRLFIVAGMTLQAAAMASIALIAEPGLAYWELLGPFMISGAGVAMASPATQSAVLSEVAAENIGKASGTYSTIRQLGGAFGVAVLVADFAASGGYASAQDFTDGFAAAIFACAALSLTGAAVGMPLHGRRVIAEQPAPAAVELLDATKR
jgi:MFS family permease